MRFTATGLLVHIGGVLSLIGVCSLSAQTPAPTPAPIPAARFDLEELRQTARMIPGRRAVRINTIAFAASLRTK
ncbi:MAG: hypothetical protein ABL995_21030, partial [Bryobacteraceae bacterium]